jgi:hypothetical protein
MLRHELQNYSSRSGIFEIVAADNAGFETEPGNSSCIHTSVFSLVINVLADCVGYESAIARKGSLPRLVGRLALAHTLLHNSV